MKKRFVILLIIEVLFLSSFFLSSSHSNINRNTVAIDEVVMIGNPAATYCQNIMGYEYKIVTEEDGGQNGFCQMPDGNFCNQWDFYAGTCGVEYSYCNQTT